MARIVLNEQQFKDYTRMLREAEKRKNYVRGIIKESLGEACCEGDMYTQQDWERDGDLKIVPGQVVSDDVVRELRDCVPPTTLSRGLFQPGEAYTCNSNYEQLYMTFVRQNEGWKYIGNCKEGSTTPEESLK